MSCIINCHCTWRYIINRSAVFFVSQRWDGICFVQQKANSLLYVAEHIAGATRRILTEDRMATAHAVQTVLESSTCSYTFSMCSSYFVQ